MNKKDIDVQVARLLNLLGHDGLKLYNTIKKEEQETVDTILQSLELYCIPKANEIIENFNFFNLTYCPSIERAESNRRTLSSTKDVDKVVHGVGFKSKWKAKYMEKINNSNQNQWKGNTANDRQMETNEEKVYSIQNEWCKVFQVNGKNVNFKLDSGAEVNTLSGNDCEKLNLMKEIKKSNIVLEVYGDFKMKPIGVVKAILTLGDQNIETEFVDYRC
ncbi:Uncharacterized protein FWK35_00035077 [Aphis craccivora]|uniref:Peptidase A2 domain-containing protein n=1 Tax=Aphis craccivora TaxID=307492 RepID=A0A6G0VNV7_APHCR|nr:Uncharacterized protein FWK35_00035077 [Aphis craccivora]